MKRESLSTLLVLLKTIERFKAGTMNEADRQLVGNLLADIAHDRDAREYFWRSVKHRPAKHSPAAYCAALMFAIAQAKGERLASKQVQAATGLTRKQVDAARKKHGPSEAMAVAQWGVEFSEQYLQSHLEDLRRK